MNRRSIERRLRRQRPDRPEHDAIASRDLTSYDEVLRFMVKGLEQIIHGFETVDALLTFVRCCPFDELTWVPARVGDP